MILPSLNMLCTFCTGNLSIGARRFDRSLTNLTILWFARCEEAKDIIFRIKIYDEMSYDTDPTITRSLSAHYSVKEQEPRFSLQVLVCKLYYFLFYSNHI